VRLNCSQTSGPRAKGRVAAGEFRPKTPASSWTHGLQSNPHAAIAARLGRKSSASSPNKILSAPAILATNGLTGRFESPHFPSAVELCRRLVSLESARSFTAHIGSSAKFFLPSRRFMCCGSGMVRDVNQKSNPSRDLFWILRMENFKQERSHVKSAQALFAEFLLPLIIAYSP
jgi:hypothetical protein